MASVLPLTCGRVVVRARKGGDNLAIFADGVPSTMVEMQVGVYHNVDIFGSYAGRAQVVQQFGRLTVDFCHFFRKFVANPGFDQDIFVSCPNKQRVEPGSYAILCIRSDLFRPEYFRDHSEEASAIEKVSSVRDDSKFEITESCCVHPERPIIRELVADYFNSLFQNSSIK